jgi:HSP20 family molecular chaperone IbpA
MSKIKQKISITEAEDRRIRREYDQSRSRWYYSVADVMAILTESVDARSYWKTLKSRLNKTRPELVSDCYQLKMKASDGKSYLVDTADADTLVKIIELVAPFNVQVFKSWFDHIDVQKSQVGDNKTPTSGSLSVNNGQSPTTDASEISTAMEPSVDIYETKGEIVVVMMLAGASPDKTIISTNMNMLTIKGNRISPEKVTEENYLHKELMWGEFYKQIELPTLVDVEKVSAIEEHGLLTIHLPKIDKDKIRFIKIKKLL